MWPWKRLFVSTPKQERMLRRTSCVGFEAQDRLRHNFTAMEFAITARAGFAGADNSWLPGGARSFFFCAGRAAGSEIHCVYC
jgi:hypothetical protein